MKRPVLMGLACLFLGGITSIAQEKTVARETLNEVVVSATKFAQKKEKTAKVIYQITQQDIQKNQGSTVIDLINRLPGVEIRGVNANPSEPRGLFLRGGRGRQVLVLIDGVPVSDPSGINQEFDLRYLSLNQIERIEVLKGASSTLYGTGAATGVINIILKKAVKNQVRIAFDTSVGSNNSLQRTTNQLDNRNLNASVSYAEDQLRLLTAINLQSTGGQSAALDANNTGFDTDPYTGENVLVKLGYSAHKNLKFTAFFNHDSFRFDYDGGTFTDAEANQGRQHQTRFGVTAAYKYNKGELLSTVSINTLRRTDLGAVVSVFEGSSKFVDVVNKFKLHPNWHFITGINYQEHDNNTSSPFGDIDNHIANFSTWDPYASLVYTTNEGFNANLGARLNNHSEYGAHWVYDASVSHPFSIDERLKGKFISSLSSAFIAPSTYQLFSAFGNVDLNPESSTTFEFGFESNFGQKFEWNTVYFNRKESDAIIFASLNVAPFGRYENSEQSIAVDGIETELSYKVSNKLRLYANYTYTNKEEDIDYIPSHKWLANLEYAPLEKLTTVVTYRNVGERLARYFDVGSFSTVEQTLANYQLLDINASYQISEKFTVYGQLTNLFNEDFQDILGFTTRSRNFLLGMRFNL